jgi:hypothetical protein
MAEKIKKSEDAEDNFMIKKFENPKDAEDARRAMAKMWGPGHVDHLIRQCLQACWMGLPKERQNADEVSKEVRRLVERALKDLAEDSKAFQLP